MKFMSLNNLICVVDIWRQFPHKFLILGVQSYKKHSCIVKLRILSLDNKIQDFNLKLNNSI